MYADGKLVFAGNRFNGYGTSKRDFTKQVSASTCAQCIFDYFRDRQTEKGGEGSLTIVSLSVQLSLYIQVHVVCASMKTEWYVDIGPCVRKSECASQTMVGRASFSVIFDDKAR